MKITTDTAAGVAYATLAAQHNSDASYTRAVNDCIERWSSFLDLSTRSVGIFTLTMLDYIDELLAHFFDRDNYPDHARLAVRENKKALRDVQAAATTLRRVCAPQRNTEWWPAAAVREAISRYKQHGVQHDMTILHYTLRNYLFRQHLDLPDPLYDLYFCTCLVRLIDINVDCYSRSLIDIDPLFADILNLPSPAADTAVQGKHTPLHLLADRDTKLHARLKHTDPQLHTELSHRRFAATRPLRTQLTAVAVRLFGKAAVALPDSGTLMADKELSPVGQAAVILLNRANKTDFIRRATEPKAWEEFDRIEQDYRDWLDAADRDHDLQAAHEWKLQSEVCGEHQAALNAAKLYEDTLNGTADPMPKDTALLTPAAIWLKIITGLEQEWQKAEAEARRAFCTERAAMAKLHPDWTLEKVDRAVSEIQYGIHEAALMYDVEALRHHLERVRPKGVTKKALQHERVQRRKATKTAKQD